MIKNNENKQFSEWMFQRVLSLARGRLARIKVVFKKIEKEKPRKNRKVYHGPIGEMEPGYNHYLIIIDSRITERSKIRVFCHELLHILFNVIKDESVIEKMEHMLWRNLNEDQKQELKTQMQRRLKATLKNPVD